MASKDKSSSMRLETVHACVGRRGEERGGEGRRGEERGGEGRRGEERGGGNLGYTSYCKRPSQDLEHFAHLLTGLLFPDTSPLICHGLSARLAASNKATVRCSWLCGHWGRKGRGDTLAVVDTGW